MNIQEAWDRRRELCIQSETFHNQGIDLGIRQTKIFAKSNTLYSEGKKLESSKFSFEAEVLRAERDRAYAESDRLRCKGGFIFFDAVFSVYGETEIKWDGQDCIVCGIRYEWEPKAPAPCDGKEVEIDGVKYKLIQVK